MINKYLKNINLNFLKNTIGPHTQTTLKSRRWKKHIEEY